MSKNKTIIKFKMLIRLVKEKLKKEGQFKTTGELNNNDYARAGEIEINSVLKLIVPGLLEYKKELKLILEDKSYEYFNQALKNDSSKHYSLDIDKRTLKGYLDLAENNDENHVLEKLYKATHILDKLSLYILYLGWKGLCKEKPITVQKFLEDNGSKNEGILKVDLKEIGKKPKKIESRSEQDESVTQLLKTKRKKKKQRKRTLYVLAIICLLLPCINELYELWSLTIINPNAKCDIFEKQNEKFKILILPFKVDEEKESNKDIGSLLKKRLTILSQNDSLNTHLIYHEIPVSRNFNPDSALFYLNRCKADLIIYGTFIDIKTDYDSVIIDYNWILSDKYNLDTLQIETLINEKRSLIPSLRKGHLQGGTDYVVYFSSSISAFFQGKYQKSIDLTNYINDSIKIFSSEVSLIRGNALSRLGYYKRALIEYENGLKLCKGKSATYWQLLSNVSMISLNKLGQFNVKYFQNQVDAINNLKQTNSLDYVSQGYINLISSQIEYGLFKEALNNAIEYKAYFEKQENRKPIHEFSYYRELGIAYEKLYDYSAASTSYEMALKVAEKYLPVLRKLILRDLIIINQNIGSFRKVSELEIMISELVRLEDNSTDNNVEIKPQSRRDSLSFVKELQLLSYTGIQIKSYSIAYEYLDKALRIQQKVNPEDFLLIANIKNQMAIYLEYMGKKEEARQMYQDNNLKMKRFFNKNNPRLMDYRTHELIFNIFHSDHVKSPGVEITDIVSNPNSKKRYIIHDVDENGRHSKTIVSEKAYKKFISKSRAEKEKKYRDLIQKYLLELDTINSWNAEYFGPNSVPLAELNRVAAIGYEDLKDYKQAAAIYIRTFDIFDKNNIQNISLAKLYTDYASFLFSRSARKYSKEIISSLKKSIELKKFLLGESNQQLLVSYYLLLKEYALLGEINKVNDLAVEINSVHVYDTNSQYYILIKQIIEECNDERYYTKKASKSLTKSIISILVLLSILFLALFMIRVKKNN